MALPLAERADGSRTEDANRCLPDYEELLASDVAAGETPLAEILRLSTEAKISFGGGLPAPETFPDPIPLLHEALNLWKPDRIMQYGRTGGFIPLCEAAVPWLRSLTVEVEKPSDILVTSGSQTALSIVARVLLGKPDQKVAVTSPTYLGALDAFGERHPQYVIVDSDEHGMVPEALDLVLYNHEVKFVYDVPDFQNPSGATVPLDRRRSIADIIRRHSVLFVEDAPYRQLRFEGEHIPTVHSLARENVIFMTTLSKVLAPGLRVGFTVAPPQVTERMITVSGWRHLCGSIFDQAIAAVYIAGGHLDRHVPEIVDHYRPRRDAMLAALEEHFPSDWTWVKPPGGMFIWPQGPQGTNTRQIFHRALKLGVAFVPGDLFYPLGGVSGAMRLNFSKPDVEAIWEGIVILGNVIKEKDGREGEIYHA